MKKSILLYTLLIFSLFSCNDVSDFLFETEQAVEIRTIENGSIFTGGQSFPLNIYSERAIVPEVYTVTIIDEDGVNWGETSITIDDPQEEYTSTLVVPEELPPGKYVFHIQVFENDQEITSREIILFKTDDEYSIDELISLPHETEAGKDVYIQATVSAPDDVDPYLRWSLNGIVLNEGFFSDGMDTLYWLAEEKAGLYSILLELFPEESASDMVSSVSDIVEIVVSGEVADEEASLQPEEDYSLLYHFSGDLSPESSDNFVNSVIGEAGALPFNDTFHYTFSGNNGISAAGAVLPVENGLLTPFSINGRLSLLAPVAPGYIFRILEDQNQFLSVRADEEGYLILNLNNSESRSLVSVQEMTDLTVHVIPGLAFTEVRWFFDGIQGGADFFETGLLALSDEHEALIGGDAQNAGAGIVLDEFGIYRGSGSTSSVDSSQFRRVKENLLGSDLIDADGFDGLESGRRIAADDNILISEFTGSVKDMEGILAFEDLQESLIWNIVLTDESGNVLYTIPQTALQREADPEFGLERDKVRFSLITEDLQKQIVINNDDSTSKLLDSFIPGERYSLFLETHVENKSDVVLDYYIIYTKTDSLIPETVAAVEEEEDLL